MSDFYIKFIGYNNNGAIEFTQVFYYSCNTKLQYEQALCQIVYKYVHWCINSKLTINIYISDKQEYDKGMAGKDIRNCDEKRRLYCLEDSFNLDWLEKYQEKCQEYEKRYYPYIKSAMTYYDLHYRNIYRYIWEELLPSV